MLNLSEVYVGGPCSYLGYGLMAGRAAVLAWEEARAANPCVPTDHSVCPLSSLHAVGAVLGCAAFEQDRQDSAELRCM